MRELEVRDNKLIWGGYKVDELAAKFGTPLFVYNEKILISAIEELQKGPWEIHYAVKANPSPEALKTMLKFGIGIDAVSANEVEYAISLGFDQAKIVYTSSSLSENEAKRVTKDGVLVNLNSIEEIELYGKISPNANIGIRLNPEVRAGHHRIVETATEISKFGILLKDVPKAVEIAKKYNLKITMVHFHIGSGILDAELFVKAFENVLDVVREIELPDLNAINLGGGFGTPYHPDSNRLNLGYLINGVKELHENFVKETGKKAKLIIEPGRYLINEAGILVVNVNTISKNHVRTFYRIDSGFNHLIRPAMYGAYHHFLNASKVEGEKELVVLSGNICEGGDVFNDEPRELAKAEPNDKIAILDAGAYGVSMGMEIYNLRGLPTEIMIKSDGKIVKYTKDNDLKDILNRYERCEIPSLS